MMLHLLNNRNFVLGLAFVVGLLFGDLAEYTEALTIPALAIILTVSITQVTIEDFLPLRSLLRPFIWTLCLNYVVLGSLFMFMAWLLLPDEFWIGYVIIAASPPGAAIIPFTYIRNGDLVFSLMGTFVVYLAALLITPLLLFVLTGGVLVSPWELFMTMVQIILIPFIISQVLNALNLSHYIESWRSTVIKWGFFVVIFTVVGLNRDAFVDQPLILLKMIIIALITTLGLLLVLKYLLSPLKIISLEESRSLVLISTIKNMGFASAIALAFFDESASLPGAVTAAFYAVYFIYLGMSTDKREA